jgi:hypothetical protein
VESRDIPAAKLVTLRNDPNTMKETKNESSNISGIDNEEKGKRLDNMYSLTLVAIRVLHAGSLIP